MRFAPVYLLLGLSVAFVVGCADAGVASSGSGDAAVGGGGSDAGGAGGQGNPDGGGGGVGGTAYTCTSGPTANPLTCVPGVGGGAAACAVVFDVEISCAEDDFAAAGLRGVATADTAFVATSTSDHARLFSLDAGGAVSEVEGFDLHAAPIDLAIGPDNRLLLAGDETKFVGVHDYGGGLTALVGLPGAFTRTTVDDNTARYTPFTDVAVAPDGAPLVFFQSKWFDGEPWYAYAVGTVGVDGVTRAPAPFPKGTDWVHFGVATDGARIAFGVDATDVGAYELRVHDGGVDTRLGAPFIGGFNDEWAYIPVRPPVGSSSEVIRYAALLQDGASLRAVHPSPSAVVEREIPGATTLAATCAPGGFVEPGDACSGNCHETGVGVESRAFGAARLPGDILVSAFVVTHRDDRERYVKSCQMDIGCSCGPVVVDDGTTRELVVVRTSMIDGIATELARSPIGVLDVQGLWSPEGAGAVDVGARGDDVVISMRLVDGQRAKVRVIRVATGGS